MSFWSRLFGKRDQSCLGSGELFSALSPAEKRKALDLNEVVLQSILAARNGANIINVAPGAEFVEKMTDDEIRQAIELGALSRKATNTTDDSDAIRIFEQVIARAPFDSISLMSAGVRYANLGDGHKAIAYLEKALKSDPGNSRIRNNLEGVRNHFGL